ncbi:BDR-repeat family protein (plasmid) [Borrelia nietonii YOR]|uniref:BDR-repeat family protein n=2 Tax=Borrelia TaxID=138 RepID=W5SBG5_9SPIR|nr:MULTISPECIES: Bdr family repetitive protein [Borrelia]AHH04285.1 BDR-repeat family protein [Borrelia nietonii YOR]AHH14682.1 BDR-repeat family protein [Borrelia hermsii MTW]
MRGFTEEVAGFILLHNDNYHYEVLQRKNEFIRITNDLM